MKRKEMTPDERHARLWQIGKQIGADIEVPDEQLEELGLFDWMKEDNSLARMCCIFFCCTAIACAFWITVTLTTYFTTGDTEMFLASPLIAFPLYKTIEYFVKRSRRNRRWPT